MCMCVCVRERGRWRQLNCSWLYQYVYWQLLVHFLFISDHLLLSWGSYHNKGHPYWQNSLSLLILITFPSFFLLSPHNPQHTHTHKHTPHTQHTHTQHTHTTHTYTHTTHTHTHNTHTHQVEFFGSRNNICSPNICGCSSECRCAELWTQRI